jgi:DeoR/GlpR family transcriptional regulator of sugar metabolism
MILKEVNIHNKVLSADLSEQLDVSEDTIRRDLHELAEQGIIVKVHGGAMSKAFYDPFAANTVYAQPAKQVISEKVAGLLQRNMTVLMEGGTTMMEIARGIPEDLEAVFFALSPSVAIVLSEHEGLEVITIGGRLTKGSNLHTGARVINALAEMKVDLCIIGANGISVEGGVTDSDLEVVEVIKAAIRSAEKVACACISEKLNTAKRMKICDLSAIDYLITELAPGSPELSAYGDAKTKIL